MQVIVYATGAVGCAVMTPAPGHDIEDVAARDVPAGAAAAILDDSALPTGAPSSAWILAEGKISVDQAVLTVALAQSLVAAASAACDALTAQIVPSETHRIAYGNAAAIVLANGGQAPSAGSAKTVFAMLAAAVELEPDTFATVAQEVSLVSLQLAAALSTLRAAAASAKASSDLASALTAFEGSLSALVTALTSAGLTVAVTAPAAIVIPGINA